MKENNNSHNYNEQIIDQLYQQGNQDLPSSSLDNLILHRAENSTQVTVSQTTWRPWLAAASVVFAIPLIWLLTQNNELIEYQTPIPSVVAPKVSEEGQPLTNEALPAVEMSKPTPRPNAAPAMADSVVDDQDNFTEAEKSTGTGALIKESSLEANRELLKRELKGNKKSIKQSNIDPIMALELQQFEQYLANQQLTEAEQLLNDMQDTYPDFNYADLIDLMADAKNNQ